MAKIKMPKIKRRAKEVKPKALRRSLSGDEVDSASGATLTGNFFEVHNVSRAALTVGLPKISHSKSDNGLVVRGVEQQEILGRKRLRIKPTLSKLDAGLFQVAILLLSLDALDVAP